MLFAPRMVPGATVGGNINERMFFFHITILLQSTTSLDRGFLLYRGGSERMSDQPHEGLVGITVPVAMSSEPGIAVHLIASEHSRERTHDRVLSELGLVG